MHEPDLFVATLLVNGEFGFHVVVARRRRPDFCNKWEWLFDYDQLAGLLAKRIPVVVGNHHDIRLQHGCFWPANVTLDLDAEALLWQLQPQLMSKLERHILMFPAHRRFLHQYAIMQFPKPLDTTEQEGFKILFG